MSKQAWMCFLQGTCSQEGEGGRGYPGQVPLLPLCKNQYRLSMDEQGVKKEARSLMLVEAHLQWKSTPGVEK